jgi:hypothetical protein
MSQPERPTCKTCPYFRPLSMDVEYGLDGECRRFPPAVLGKSPYKDNPTHHLEGWHPYVSEGHWCGEHPDFPAYIDSLKPRPAPGTLDPGKLSVMARATVARLGGVDAKITLDDLDSAVGCGPATRGEIINFFKANGVEIA